MKKVLLGLMAFVLLTVTANAGAWTSLMSISDKKVVPTPFQLDTHGWNVRGYEFIPPNAPHKQCVILFSESKYKAPVMQCFDRKEK